MPKERSDQVRQLLDATQGAHSLSFHFVLGFDELAADTQLNMRPDLLVRIGLLRVRRQEAQVRGHDRQSS